MRVLVAYGSKSGGTEGLARSIGEGLAAAGHEVVVRPAGDIDGLGGWDAVVVGGALYGWRWYRPARRFVRRNHEELAHRPVWFFSSGPLDDSASKGTIPPTGSVRRLMRKAHARSHVTFGGRLDAATATGLARVMARQGAGDWRNLDAARAWGGKVAAELSALSHGAGAPA